MLCVHVGVYVGSKHLHLPTHTPNPPAQKTIAIQMNEYQMQRQLSQKEMNKLFFARRNVIK